MPTPAKHHGVGALVDGEAPCRQGQEAKRGTVQPGSMSAEGPEVMAGKRHADRGDPSEHIGHQRPHVDLFDEQDHGAPVHGGCGATDQQEPMGSTGGPKRLCVCVDDFGLHAGINAAALDLVARGRVHALACQVGGSAWRAGASELRSFGRVDVGLHLDLTERPLRWPLQPLGTLVAASLLRRLDVAALETEIEMQLNRFESAIGRPPDFIDGHQHVHQLPQVREALLAVLLRRGSHRPWLRNTCRRTPLPGSPLMRFKPWLIEQLGAAALARQARRVGFQRNQALLGVYDFTPSAPGYAALLQGWLGAAADGDLLMCHPSRPVRCGTDAILDARMAEFDVLAGAGFGVLLSENGITLSPMSLTLGRRSH